MYRTLFRFLGPVTAAWLLAGCGSSGSSGPVAFCTAPRSIAIEVEVHDSITGAARADGATGTVATATYADSLHHDGSDTTLYSGDRLGTYQVLVQRPGYVDWDRMGIVVSTTGTCGNVLPVRLQARLVPTP
jgi:hypothetical protein